MALIAEGVGIDRLLPDFDGGWTALRRAMLAAGTSCWPDQPRPHSVGEALWLVRRASEIVGFILTDGLVVWLSHAGAEDHAGSLPAAVARRLVSLLFDGRPLPDLVRAARALHDGLAGLGEFADGALPRGKAETLIRLADSLMPEHMRGLTSTDLLESLGFDLLEIGRLLEADLPVECDGNGDLIRSRGRTPDT